MQQQKTQNKAKGQQRRNTRQKNKQKRNENSDKRGVRKCGTARRNVAIATAEAHARPVTAARGGGSG